MVYHFTPYSSERDLGRAYNHYMGLIGENDWACIRDMDTCFLNSFSGEWIDKYAEQNPNSILICQTNRIHPLSKEQLLNGEISQSTDICKHLALSFIQQSNGLRTTPCTGNSLSGFLMVIPKSVWHKVPFREGIGLLGVDTFFFRDLRAAGIPILRMDGLYIWHTYRLGKAINDTTHLR